ncbi:ribosome biogenesis GTPase Der [Streptomyces boluensis]|uniref:GTPase Der n=1 Tax=Streptomyces boluensis TaxID=1775135 RepID=A0A964UXG8_9ACTN|nr:ribosome biogenesis GTPase Der [Streptomyces boluensis]NBE54632.1 ribosome biogenesis GTPase Der [Streptomyces boluensis]
MTDDRGTDFMNEQIHSGGSDEPEHGALGDAEYAEFMELAAEEGFDLEEVEGAIGEAGHGPLPVLAVVGRPNVGKSTLVNRIIGRREAVVEDKPGVTRDRVTYEAEWAGRRFKLVDTGGWEQDVLGIDASVAAQAEYAIEAADAVVFVVDSTVGVTDTDEAVVRLLRKAKKPVVLCANKVDGQSGEADATALWSLGIGEPFPVSSLHGRGTGDMLDAVLEALPEAPQQTFGAAGIGGPRRIALIGRPNVGKSSLLNKVAKEDRVVVNEMAGTTRDPVDELIELGGVTWKFVDTAGIRKRVHLQQGADYYASLRTAAAVEKAEVAVILIDSSESISIQDQRIVTMAVEAGRAIVVAYNKWDTLDEERRYYLEREIETELGQVAWAPRVNVSARTGRHMEKLVPAIETAIEGWETRVPTGRLNAFLGELVAAHPHPVRGGKQPRILFGTQAGTKPPRFVLFASGFIEAGYRRYVERRLREEFGFEGTPIHISVRVREKRGRKK